MSVEFQQDNDVISVKITEALTIFEAGDVADQLAAKLVSASHCQVDLSGVEEIDAAGIQLLLSLQKTLRSSDDELIVASASDAVMDTLDMFGLGNYFSFREEGTENA